MTKPKITITDQQRVSTISEALPYIREFSGKTFVIKYGGASMKDPLLKKKVIEDIALLHYVGVRPIVVHGGGPEINHMLGRLGIESKFRDGLRITDEKTMEIVEMVLAGKVQKDLVGLLGQAGAKAIGLSGKDANLMQAFRLTSDIGDDWGFTGDVKSVSVEILELLTAQGYIPVISSVAPDENYHSCNINADTVASEIAIALKAQKLILLTDTQGLLMDKDQPESLIRRINTQEALKLIKQGIIQGGMIPKVESAIDAVKKGVGSVHILNGNHDHILLLETFTEAGVGTMIEAE
ncbi:MAG: acetylglutamate kinase [Candidatus Melainabacteria bacterium]|jgi:acetylglutamate kinase